jgi:hypothetical protein
MLCAHAAKPFHTLSRMVWIADLAMVLGHQTETGPDVDWSAVQSVARAGRCTTAVAAVLTLARHAGVTVNPEAFPLPTRGWRASALGALADPCWPLAAQERPTFHLRYALTDGHVRRLFLLFGSTHGEPLARRAWWQARAVSQAAGRWRALRRGRTSRANGLTPAPRVAAHAGWRG